MKPPVYEIVPLPVPDIDVEIGYDGKLLATTIANVFDVDLRGLLPSETVTAKLKLPARVGVPEIVPLVTFKVRPFGSPLATCHV